MAALPPAGTATEMYLSAVLDELRMINSILPDLIPKQDPISIQSDEVELKEVAEPEPTPEPEPAPEPKPKATKRGRRKKES